MVKKAESPDDFLHPMQKFRLFSDYEMSILTIGLQTRIACLEEYLEGFPDNPNPPDQDEIDSATFYLAETKELLERVNLMPVSKKTKMAIEMMKGGR